MVQHPTSPTPDPPTHPFPDVEPPITKTPRRALLLIISIARKQNAEPKKTYRTKAYPAAGAAPRRRTAAAASFMVSGQAWQAILVFGATGKQREEPARATRKCVRGVFAGCLRKGYEHTIAQSLGRWDACLRYRINRVSHHSAASRRLDIVFSLDHWIRLHWASEEAKSKDKSTETNDAHPSDDRRARRARGFSSSSFLCIFLWTFCLGVISGDGNRHMLCLY